METVQLQYPITKDGQTINELTLRRPRVLDRILVEKTSSSAAEKEVKLLANLCEVTPATIEELDMADYLKLQEILGSFLS